MNSQQAASQDVRVRLNDALRAALRGRDQPATAALRSALAAIANAEAVDAAEQPAAARGSRRFAGAAPGLGAAEVPRRALGDGDIEDIVRAEIADREQAVGQYLQGGHTERAERLRREVAVLQAILDPAGQ